MSDYDRHLTIGHRMDVGVYRFRSTHRFDHVNYCNIPPPNHQRERVESPYSLANSKHVHRGSYLSPATSRLLLDRCTAVLSGSLFDVSLQLKGWRGVSSGDRESIYKRRRGCEWRDQYSRGFADFSPTATVPPIRNAPLITIYIHLLFGGTHNHHHNEKRISFPHHSCRWPSNHLW